MWRIRVGATRSLSSLSSKAKDPNGQVRMPNDRLAFCLVKLVVDSCKVASGQVSMMLCCMNVKRGTIMNHTRVLRKDHCGATEDSLHVPSSSSAKKGGLASHIDVT